MLLNQKTVINIIITVTNVNYYYSFIQKVLDRCCFKTHTSPLFSLILMLLKETFYIYIVFTKHLDDNQYIIHEYVVIFVKY